MSPKMSKVFIESGYRFDFSNSVKPYKADLIGKESHPLVDFVVETDDNFLLIEVKNPDNKKAYEDNPKEFLARLKSPYFLLRTCLNYTNTLLRMALEKDFCRKPIICIFILEFKQFGYYERIRLQKDIQERLPFFLNKLSKNKKQIISKFDIFTIEEFQKRYNYFSVAVNND